MNRRGRISRLDFEGWRARLWSECIHDSGERHDDYVYFMPWEYPLIPFIVLGMKLKEHREK